MFGRKARLIRELKAANETNKITIRLQDETIKKYMDLAEERGKARVDVEAKLAVVKQELHAAHEELQKTQEKLLSSEEELRLAREEATSAKRRSSYGSLDEVNSFPGSPKGSEEDPEVKASAGEAHFEEAAGLRIEPRTIKGTLWE